MAKISFSDLRVNRATISLLVTFTTFVLFWSTTYILRISNSRGALDSQINLSLFLTLFLVVGFVLVFGQMKLGAILVYAVTLGLVSAYLTTTLTLLNVDRSRSFYLLSWVDNYKLSSLEKNRDYSLVQSPEVLALKPINRRISEQVDRGFISTEKEFLELTSKGKFSLACAEFFAKYFRLSGWYLNRS